MQIARRPLRRAWLLFGLMVSLLAPAWGQQRARVKAEDYVIDAEIVPKAHRLTARAKVKITARDDINFASFELHNGLRVTKVLDANGRPLTAERVSQSCSKALAGYSGYCSRKAAATRAASLRRPANDSAAIKKSCAHP